MARDDEVSSTMHNPKTQADYDLKSRKALKDYFESSPGSTTEKLENFAKYVPRQNLARFLARCEIFRLIKSVQGSLVECGVLFGGGLMTFAKLSAILEPYNFQRRIIGFDYFTGFPKIDGSHLKGLPDRKSAHMKTHGFSAEGA
jgi:hypothetical protein